MRTTKVKRASIKKEKKKRKKGEEERREKETESGRNEELNASFRPSRVLLRSSRSDAESIHVIVPRGGRGRGLNRLANGRSEEGEGEEEEVN